jgi:lysozyme
MACALAKQFEGCRLRAYQDSGGVVTIGFGYTGHDITMQTEWTQAQADAALFNRMTESYNQLLSFSPGLRSENANKLGALTDFVYNVGIGNYARGEHLKSSVDLKQWNHAAIYIKQFVKDRKGNILQGLVKRRDAEIDLLIRK